MKKYILVIAFFASQFQWSKTNVVSWPHIRMLIRDNLKKAERGHIVSKFLTFYSVVSCTDTLYMMSTKINHSELSQEENEKISNQSAERVVFHLNIMSVLLLIKYATERPEKKTCSQIWQELRGLKN
jgi:hypothetical protein